MVTLPTEKVKASYISPRVITIYSKPKSGKTTILSMLDKILMLDFEGSTDLVDAVKVTIIGLIQPNETPEQTAARHNNINEHGNPQPLYYLTEIILELRKKEVVYEYLAIETATKLEDLCIWDATENYMKSPVGKYFNKYSEEEANLMGDPMKKHQLKPRKDWKDVRHLAKGAGYMWIQDSFEKWIEYLKPLAKYIIITAHIKISFLEKKGYAQEVEIKDLDLTGKVKALLGQLLSDGIGYFYREGNKGYLSFEVLDDTISGSRAASLEGRKILISEKLEDGTIKTYWNEIYK